MNTRTRIRGLIVLMAIIAGVVASTAMLGTPAQAARCCKVMICSNNACWEECRTCPKFP